MAINVLDFVLVSLHGDNLSVLAQYNGGFLPDIIVYVL